MKTANGGIVSVFLFDSQWELIAYIQWDKFLLPTILFSALFQKFCQNLFWRLIPIVTRFHQKKWSSFAIINTTLLLLLLQYTTISIGITSDWEQQPLTTGIWYNRLQASTAVRSGCLSWMSSGGVSPKALKKWQVLRKSAESFEVWD